VKKRGGIRLSLPKRGGEGPFLWNTRGHRRIHGKRGGRGEGTSGGPLLTYMEKKSPLQGRVAQGENFLRKEGGCLEGGGGCKGKVPLAVNPSQERERGVGGVVYSQRGEGKKGGETRKRKL